MLTLLKKLSGVIADGGFLSGHPQLEELDLDRDWPEVERLLVHEEWPFLRSDLAVSHRQPRATAFVARKHGRFAGFFTAHAFGDVGYLDMMIIAPAFRRAGIARPLYFKTVNDLKRKGVRSFVVHTTNDSAGLIRLLGFQPGQTFTLLRREPGELSRPTVDPEVGELAPGALPELVELDAWVFGAARSPWLAAVSADAGARWFGLRRQGSLLASVCLRPRRGAAVCLDMVNALRFSDLVHLLARVVADHAGRRLECFVRTGSELHGLLSSQGFVVPDFFRAIGPLTEWRKGPTGPVGASSRLQCLTWL